MHSDQNSQQIDILNSQDDSDAGHMVEQKEFSNDYSASDEMSLRYSHKEPIEMMYILFCSYRPQLEQIGQKHGCKVRIAMNSYIVGCNDPEEKQNYSKCIEKVKGFIQRIKYNEIKMEGQIQVFNFYNSPHIHALFYQKKMALIFFREKLYVYSDTLSVPEIIKQSYPISHKVFVFAIKFSKIAQIKFPSLFETLIRFFSRELEHIKEKLVEKEVIGELNLTKNGINLIGKNQKNLMYFKTHLKNLKESLVCVIVKNTTTQDSAVKAYLAKISKYPIHFERITKNSVVFISKDSIILKLIQNHKKFMQLAGIQEVPAESSFYQAETELGIYILNTNSQQYDQKIENLKQLCRQAGWDLYKESLTIMLKKIFRDEMEMEELLTMIQKMIDRLSNIKMSYHFMGHQSLKVKRQESSLESSKYDYLIVGSSEDEVQLSNLLNRQVLREKVQMKKRFVIDYNSNENEQTVIYWKYQDESKKVIDPKQFKVGKYVQGRRKLNQRKEIEDQYIYLCDYVLTVL